MLSLRPNSIAEDPREKKGHIAFWCVAREPKNKSASTRPVWLDEMPAVVLCVCVRVCVAASSSTTMDVVDFGANKQFE